MLTGSQFYDVLCAVVPLYVALFLGYGSLRWWGVVTPEQSKGISRFNAMVAMPPLVFEIIAFNDPYTMNNRLIAAYSLSNGLILVTLFAWAWLTKSGGLDWVITVFQLAVMPNTIIVGLPVLSPLYSITSSGIAAIFIGQVLWLFPILFLYELWEVKKLGQSVPVVPELLTSDNVTVVRNRYDGEEDAAGNRENSLPALATETEHKDFHININEQSSKSAIRMGRNIEGELISKQNAQSVSCARIESRDTGQIDSAMENGHKNVSSTMSIKQMAIRVGKKMMQLQLTYATLLGIIYSLIASRWGLGAPKLLKDSLDLIGRITLGLTMYTIGLFMAGEEKIISSWWVALYGAFFRFAVGPVVMGLASFLLGLRGDALRFAFLQAALPQAVISFVFARERNLHTDVFTTAVSLQTVIFMPIVLAYYTLIGL